MEIKCKISLRIWHVALYFIFKRAFKVLAHFEFKVHVFMMLKSTGLDGQNAAVWNGLTNEYTDSC